MKYDRLVNQKQKKSLNIIEESGNNLLGLLNDVLDISKIEAGHVTLNEDVFDLHHLLGLLEDMLSFRAQNKGISLSFFQQAL